MAFYSIIVFDTAEEARKYRHEQGSGGWIFEHADNGQAILFPPHMPPMSILRHPLTKGNCGRLIGTA